MTALKTTAPLGLGRFLTAAALITSLGWGAGTLPAQELPLPDLLARVNAWACVTIVALAVAIGGSAWHPDAGGAEILAIAWLGVVPGLIGHGLMNLAARSLPVHVVSITILLEPVGAALAAWWILGQGIGARDAAGAGLLLVGAAVAMLPPKAPSSR